jgi:hypothetical protein
MLFDDIRKRQWGLKTGDKLYWSLEARKNEMVIVIRRLDNQ